MTRVRLAAAAVVLIAAVLLLGYEIPPVPTWFYVLAWSPTLVVLDEVVVMLGGESLLARPRELVVILWWSAVIWSLFEAINFRLRDWYYIFLPASRLERWLGMTVSLATVVPAVLLPERLLDRLGVWHDLRFRSFTLEPRHLEIAGWVGGGLLAAVLAFPRSLYPLTWGAVWLIAEPLLGRRDPAPSLVADIARGSWGGIARPMARGLFAGVAGGGVGSRVPGRAEPRGGARLPRQPEPARRARGARRGAPRDTPRHRHRARGRPDRRRGGECRGPGRLRPRLGLEDGARRGGRGGRRAPPAPGRAGG